MEAEINPVGAVESGPSANVIPAFPRRIQHSAAAVPEQQSGVALARFAGFDPHGRPLVAEMTCAPGHLVPALSTVLLLDEMIGAQVVLMFEQGGALQPIILGVVQCNGPGVPVEFSTAAPIHAEVDSERIVISAEREIVLRCGEASITLTRAGKVIIRGSYIMSRSTGYNKIKGAAVDIN